MATSAKTAKLASANVNGKAATATKRGMVATAKETLPDSGLTAAMLKLGRIVWAAWTKGKGYVQLGIREKTAIGLETRSAMLATAAYGYKQGNGRIVAQAVRAAMGLNPNIGGIDFPWLEKPSNMATITSSATVRLDSTDGMMRLLPISTVAVKRTPKVSAEVTAIKARRAAGQRSNGNVTTSRMSTAELAKLQADGPTDTQ